MAPDTAVERSPERVFIPGIKDPFVLEQNSAPYLLTRLRDEAHRFAIIFHRQTRDKERVGSALDTIDGIGPARRNALLKRFGSLESVKAACVEALTAVEGIGPEVAAAVWAALHAAAPNSTQAPTSAP